MARYNIKLDYGELRKLSDSCIELASSLNDIETAIKNMDEAVASCSGSAAEALYGKGGEIAGNMNDLGVGLTKFSTHIVKYCNDMRAIINSASEGMLHINTVDVSWNLKQMISDLVEFDDFARTVSPNVNVSGLISSYSGLLADENAVEMNKLEGKLDNVKELLVVAANDLANYDEDFEKFRKIISEFENKDDEYRDILQEVYYEISDTGFWGRTSTKVIIGVGLVVIAVAIVFLAPILAGIGGAVGAVAAAIAGCTWLVSIATEVIAVGLLTAAFAGGIAVFSGKDIEDAVGGGLFEGTVSSVITGGAGQIAKSGKYLSYGAKALSKTKYANNPAVKENVEFVMKEGLEYAGTVSSSAFLKLYNGQDVNMYQICMNAAYDRGLSIFYKGVSEIIHNQLDLPEIQLIRDGKLSLNDVKNAITNGITNKSIDAAKEVTSQVGHNAIDQFYENQETDLQSEQEETSLEVDPEKATQSLVKNDIKSMAVDGIKSIVESGVEEATGVEIDEE